MTLTPFIWTVASGLDPCQQLCALDGPIICWDGSWVDQDEDGYMICANYFYTFHSLHHALEYHVAEASEFSLPIEDVDRIIAQRLVHKNQEDVTDLYDLSSNALQAFFGTEEGDLKELTFPNGEVPSVDKIAALRQFALEEPSEFLDAWNDDTPQTVMRTAYVALIIDDIDRIDWTNHPGGSQAVLIPFLVLPELFPDRSQKIPLDFWLESGLAAYMNRHSELIHKGVLEAVQMIRSCTARDPLCHTTKRVNAFIHAMGLIIAPTLTSGKDIIDSAHLIDLLNRFSFAGSEDMDVLQITLTRESDALVASLGVFSRYTALVAAGGLAIDFTFLPYMEHHAGRQYWFRLVSEDIDRLKLLEYTEDRLIIEENRSRYRAVGVIIGLSISSQTPINIAIPPKFWSIIHIDPIISLGQTESNWNFIAEGLERVIPLSIWKFLRKHHTRRFGDFVTGEPEFDVETFFQHVKFDGFTHSSPQIEWFRRFMDLMSDRERRILLHRVTGSDRIPLGGFGYLMEGIKICNSGTSSEISVYVEEARICVPAFASDAKLRIALQTWLGIEIDLTSIEEYTWTFSGDAFDPDFMDEATVVSAGVTHADWLRNILSFMDRNTRIAMLRGLTGHDFVLFNSVEVLLGRVRIDDTGTMTDLVFYPQEGRLVIPRYGSEFDLKCAIETWLGFDSYLDSSEMI